MVPPVDLEEVALRNKERTSKANDITVHFDPECCINVGNCTCCLPGIVDSDEKGLFIHPDEASAEELSVLVRSCPSGALTFAHNDEAVEEAAPKSNKIAVQADGPILIHANHTINGKKTKGFRAALCRCGVSRNKPYCDGSHKEAGFADDGRCTVADLEVGIEDASLNISTLTDGPLLLQGPFEIHDATGIVVARGKKAALCRCGASGNKPYCDGSHVAVDFKSED